MNPTEREMVSVALCRLWPGKFRDVELVDICDRLDAYRGRDVVAAINAHKNEKPFRPQVNELLARLKGKETGAAAGLPKHDSLAEAVRKQRPEMEGVPEAEVVLRHWRSEWFRYKARADGRRAGMELAFARNKTPKPTRATLTRAHDRNAASFRKRCVVGCTGCLVFAGADSTMARRYAMAAVKADAGTFRHILANAGDIVLAGVAAS